MSDKKREAQGMRLRRAREAAGYRSAMSAAQAFGWRVSSYGAHERGSRTIGQDDAERYARAFKNITAEEMLFGDSPTHENAIPIMGYIGAGAEIYPEFEQVPPEGLGIVDLPFAVPDEMIGLEVRGDSMLPRYDDGDVVVCWKEGTPIHSVLGLEGAVRTSDGKRYLKRVLRGQKPGTYNLESFNARTIEGARLEWVSGIYLIVPAGQIRIVHQRNRAAARRRSSARAKLGAGTGELALSEPRRMLDL